MSTTPTSINSNNTNITCNTNEATLVATSTNCGTTATNTNAGTTTITANDDENKPPQAPQTTLRIVAPQQQSNNSEAISPSLDGSKNEVHQLQKGFSLLNTNGMNDIGQKVPATVSTVATPKEASERGPPGEELTVAARILTPLMEATSEEELLNALQGIMGKLNDKGKYLGITKVDFIKFGKEKRKMVKSMANVWTKKVASNFGATLKRLNALVALEQKRDEAAEKLLQSGVLQQFGCLYGDSYSLSRNILTQGILSGVRFVRIDCGGQHASALTADGDVYTWGAGSFGQLGHGNRTSREGLSKVNGIPKSSWIACGYAFTCAVSKDGEMFAWGAGENGRLGTGTTDDICVPTKIAASWKAKKIFAGSVHTCALSEESEMYSWGHRNYTGHGGTEDVLTPKILETLEGKLCHMASIGPGGYHTMALTVSGAVYTWGHNRVGQLGFDNDTSTSTTPEGAYFYPVPRFVSALAGMQIRAVSAGWGHSAVLNYKGDVYMCGRNYRGQVGMQPSACPRNERGHPYLPAFTLVDGLAGLKIEQIACGGEHTAAVTSDGELYLWGDDACAQLGHSASINQEYSSGQQKYKWYPKIVDGEPCVGKVVHVALGSAVTFLLSSKDD